MSKEQKLDTRLIDLPLGMESSDDGDTMFPRTPNNTLNYNDALLDTDGIIEIFEDNGGDLPIADVHGPKSECGNRFTREEAIANAERIVRCVNAHADLVAALELALGALVDGGYHYEVEQARKALEKHEQEIKHPVVTVTLSVVCRADEKQDVLDSMTEWYFSKYTPTLGATGKPKVSKRREATKGQLDLFGFDEEDEDEEEAAM